ncbi:GGDEF domain-containing protein [Halioglobus maricola]|uniref:GGDEF domain-containing protein n=1 Tax=Halioglobus maricola TaxID=2601894 RepID=A0A5P9NEV7_9GAMM|nr:GGDEF domain-containing phosphodiesterase [Halioglobus maricola]QFU74277.1 GGDEF domain-containing protein [Halioglobus maricola]
MASRGNMIGLVELADAETLLNRHGRASFSELQEVFIKRLQGWIRSKDELKILEDGRFCVELKGVGSRGELELATAKLQRIFQEPHYQFGRPVNLEFTAGFTQVSAGEANRENAMREAGLALRQARSSSRPFDLYQPQEEMDPDAERKLVRKLENALEVGDLQLHYQPKVHAQYHSLVGAEALLRWHTRDALIGPNKFIQIAERHDVITHITWFAIKSATARLARWPGDLSIAVNVAPNLLLNDQIVSVVHDALDIYGVKPGRLTIEVTERVMIDDPQVMLQQLSRLRELGVKISLDDFGTGFSSLSYFRDLPVDEIKIDKSFVSSMLDSKKDLAIVKAVIDLAHNFSMRVVAEGVESMEIAQRLSDLGCDVLQGYVFDKPLPVQVFELDYGISKESSSKSRARPSSQLN